ncbi:hypothetical protein B0H16DRAFT_1474767 [Mycena metata]|uniref:Uncharacterized protein n=1 Tax=Mycena metata TaxID=1033252 RepID=A0AAD7HFQ2_9AGAR|nr:hypothetical protein B0H16DRAFT_1474767 [Mycena metata]
MTSRGGESTFWRALVYQGKHPADIAKHRRSVDSLTHADHASSPWPLPANVPLNLVHGVSPPLALGHPSAVQTRLVCLSSSAFALRQQKHPGLTPSYASIVLSIARAEPVGRMHHVIHGFQNLSIEGRARVGGRKSQSVREKIQAPAGLAQIFPTAYPQIPRESPTRADVSLERLVELNRPSGRRSMQTVGQGQVSWDITPAACVASASKFNQPPRPTQPVTRLRWAGMRAGHKGTLGHQVTYVEKPAEKWDGNQLPIGSQKSLCARPAPKLWSTRPLSKLRAQGQQERMLLKNCATRTTARDRDTSWPNVSSEFVQLVREERTFPPITTVIQGTDRGVAGEND